LAAPDLNYLTHFAIGLNEYLSSREIVNISRFTSLKKLELFGWEEWDDLSPLGCLPLEELSCTNLCMLLSLLSPGSLRSLRSFTIDHGMDCANNNVDCANNNELTWLKRRGMNEHAFVVISEGLLALPSLEDFSQGLNYHVASGLECWVKTIADLNPNHWRVIEHNCGRSLYRRVRATFTTSS
jgi:hypothetical protein